MQLWLKEISAEYAMNKPPEEEIWPNAREIRKRPWRRTIFTETGGIRIEVDEDYVEKEYSDENIKTKYIRTHRTHRTAQVTPIVVPDSSSPSNTRTALRRT